MSNIIVNVLTPNGRRPNIKVEPNKTILKILEEVCTKYEFDPQEYDLTHHKRILDVTTMFRFSGLPNNAQLEMVKTTKKRAEESEVTLMLQLEDGSRSSGSFSPSVSLLDVIGKLAPEKSTASDLVFIFMRTEVFGEALASTTLKSLGLTGGRAMGRLLQRNPEVLKTQANVSAPIGGTVANESNSTEKSTINDKLVADSPSTSPNDKKMKLENNDEPAECESVTNSIKERNAVLFSLDSAQSIEYEIEDSFFDLTVKDMNVLLQDLRKQTEEIVNAPLLTAKMRELEQDTQTLIKLNRYKKTVIRIQFPNRLVLQGLFQPIDTVAVIMEFIRPYLANENTDFHLYTTPPKHILSSESRLIELHCVPSALLHFGCDSLDTENILKPELSTQVKTLNDAVKAAVQLRGLSATESTDATEQTNSQIESGPSNCDSNSKKRISGTFRESSAVSSDVKFPKWFKPTGK